MYYHDKNTWGMPFYKHVILAEHVYLLTYSLLSSLCTYLFNALKTWCLHTEKKKKTVDDKNQFFRKNSKHNYYCLNKQIHSPSKNPEKRFLIPAKYFLQV